MNFYNPYYYVPYSMPTSRGLFSRLLGGINISSILNGTQKTLNIVNQAIPVVKQITPMVKNAKTMFSVMNEFKKIDEVPPTTVYKEKEEVHDYGPVFFK